MYVRGLRRLAHFCHRRIEGEAEYTGKRAELLEQRVAAAESSSSTRLPSGNRQKTPNPTARNTDSAPGRSR